LPFDDFGLVVNEGQPALLVRVQPSTVPRTMVNLGSEFRHPPLFLPYKTARWDDTPRLIDEECLRGLDEEMENDSRRISEKLGAVTDHRGKAIAAGRVHTL